MRNVLAVLVLFAISACSLDPAVTRVSTPPPAVTSSKSFGAFTARPSLKSNAEFSRDFLRLAFELESGRAMPVLARFEGPISVRLTGAPARQVTSHDLDQLLVRLRSEAKLDIRRVPAGQSASITVELVDAASMRRVAPNAACFVAPNVSGWADFRQARSRRAFDWTLLRERTEMSVFIPATSSPQEIRDCLHEEIAQALGPVNDLFDLPDSVFNDDNFHAVLTGFDMEVLKVFYHPALSNGMNFDHVADELPAILAALRPQASPSRRHPEPGFTPATWKDAIGRALGPSSANFERISSAKWALDTARSMGWRDTRLGFSLYAYGRLNTLQNPDAAIAAFAEADRVFSALPDSSIHSAHLAVHAAANALTRGRYDTVIAIVDANTKVALQAQNASLLSTLLMLKATALDAMGSAEEARLVELDSLGWAGYAFATSGEITSRRNQIKEMAPTTRRGGDT